MEVGFVFIDGGDLPNARSTAGRKMTSREVREADKKLQSRYKRARDVQSLTWLVAGLSLRKLRFQGLVHTFV